MDKLFLAIRNGKYQEAIEIGNKQLCENPNDMTVHFSLVQAYESTQQYELALSHVKKSLKVIPNLFEALTLAARCASNVNKYEEAYKYAELALKDAKNPNLPKLMQVIFKLLSYVPGLSNVRNANDMVVSTYSKQTLWLRDYINWFKSQKEHQS